MGDIWVAWFLWTTLCSILGTFRSLRFTVGWPLKSCIHTGIFPSVSDRSAVKRKPWIVSILCNMYPIWEDTFIVSPHHMFDCSNDTSRNDLISPQVQTLRDFFCDDSTFIAYGNERYAMDDFEMDNNGECRRLNSGECRRLNNGERREVCTPGQTHPSTYNTQIKDPHKYQEPWYQCFVCCVCTSRANLGLHLDITL